MSVPVASTQEFINGARIEGLPLAIAPGQPLTFEQIGGGAPSTPPRIYFAMLDFGDNPVYSKQFLIPLAAVTPAYNVMMSVSGEMPGGLMLDELEMDQIHCAAWAPSPGLIQAIITATPGPVIGPRNFIFHIGV